MKIQAAGRMGETGHIVGSFSFSEFEFELRYEASVSRSLNRGTDTELPAEDSPT